MATLGLRLVAVDDYYAWAARGAVDEWLAQHNWTHAAEEARAFGYFKAGRHLKKRNYVFKASFRAKPFRIWSWLLARHELPGSSPHARSTVHPYPPVQNSARDDEQALRQS